MKFLESKELRMGLVTFIDGIVGEVHVGVGDVAALILFGAKASEPFLVDEDHEGVDGSDDDVDSEIELLAVDQVGVSEVLLDDVAG